jgi:hypothetical protein
VDHKDTGVALATLVVKDMPVVLDTGAVLVTLVVQAHKGHKAMLAVLDITAVWDILVAKDKLDLLVQLGHRDILEVLGHKDHRDILEVLGHRGHRDILEVLGHKDHRGLLGQWATGAVLAIQEVKDMLVQWATRVR